LYIYAFAPADPSDQRMPLLPSPAHADYRGRFSDHCLRTGEWPALGVHPEFVRDAWPFGEVLHREHLTGRCELVRLDDRNPLKMVGFERIDCDRGGSLPSDSLESPYLFMTETLPGLRMPDRRGDTSWPEGAGEDN
jgi:hypothetical protein